MVLKMGLKVHMESARRSGQSEPKKEEGPRIAV
jgi:hypothetical protein